MTIWTIRPTTRGEARPGIEILLLGLAALGAAGMLGFDLSIAVLFAIAALLSIAHWWNASARVVGRELERKNLLGAVTLRGQVKWASVDATGRIRCTMDDSRFVELDGEWSNARGLYEALGDAGVASRSAWPARWSGKIVG